jgi:hypothetical protein
MPEVDFMILCDYVRVQDGLFHMIGGSIDRLYTPAVPSAHNVGIAIKIALTRAECDYEHRVDLIFQGQDGQRYPTVNGKFRVKYDESLPPGWPAYGAIPFNLALPLPAYGIYSLELLIDGQARKSISVQVIPRGEARDSDGPDDQ